MIQIDMQMPKNCIDCPVCNEYLMCAIPCNGRGFGENDVKDFSKSRPEWCPMEEQQLVKPTYRHVYTTKGWFCGVCDKRINRAGKYCCFCGTPVDWS